MSNPKDDKRTAKKFPTDLEIQIAEQRRSLMVQMRHSMVSGILEHARANGGSIEPHKIVSQAKALSAWIMNGTMPKEPPVA